MNRHATPRLSLVIALAALLLAVLGATPVATAVQQLVLPPKSVGTPQLKAGAVTSLKVKDGSLTAVDFEPGQLRAGPPGLKGGKGDPGATSVTFRRAVDTLSHEGPWLAVAECLPGEKLIGGGAGLLTPGDTMAAGRTANLIASYPATTFVNAAKTGDTPTRWVAGAYASAASETRVASWAICAQP
jgi:hypothetical protein